MSTPIDISARIVIDTREHALGEALKRIECDFEWKQLDVGDIEFHVKSQEDTTPYLTVERKTFPDLASSLSDGRFSEQRHRLSDNRLGIAYVIEGRDSFACQTPGVRGALLSLSLNHKIPVFRTADVDDTAFWIKNTYEYLSKPARENEGYAGAACRASCVKKKDNVDPRQCYLHQLSQIPGLSYGMATRIANKPGFETMRKLIATLEGFSTDKERKATLQSIEKIGPKLADRVVTYLFSNAPVSSIATNPSTSETSECLFLED